MTATAPSPIPGGPPTVRGNRRGPVRWLSIPELWRSGREVATATNFARFADARKTQGALPEEDYDLSVPFEVKGKERAFRIDYVADTGDGFDATYAVARAVEGGVPGGPERRSHLLMLGGDEVYPVASVAHYDDRFSLPWDLARAWAEPQEPGGEPTKEREGLVAAIPGNHDWYDSLSAFMRIFCQSWLADPDRRSTPRTVDVWETPTSERAVWRSPFQSRSYFAARLPHGWWLWGVDIQLDAYIDEFQLAYFTRARERVEAHERVIICTARPAWVDDPALDSVHFTSNRQTLCWFVNRMFGNDDAGGAGVDRLRQVPIVISGDKHHYVHYSRDPASELDDDRTAPEHLITCGGGGAHLSSTHHAAPEIAVPWHLESGPGKTIYRHRDRLFPTWSDSRFRLSAGFLKIAVLNGPWTPLALVAANLALLLAFLSRDLGDQPGSVVPAAIGSALVALLFGAISSAFRPRQHHWFPALVPGILHGLVYVTVACALSRWIVEHPAPSPDSIADAFAKGNLVVTGSALLIAVALGPVIFATYFLVSDLFGWHENEFFSGMGIEGYKSFLRIEIAPRGEEALFGTVTITAYGIRGVVHNMERPDKDLGPSAAHVIDRITWSEKEER